MKKLAMGAAMIAALMCGSSATAATGCDRACLDGKLNEFLGAVVAKDPGKAPLAVGFRETQNTLITPAGQGIWQTNTGLGPLQRHYLDPATGQAEFFGLVKEGDALGITSLRIKVENQKITEAEWFIARKADPGITGEPGKVLFDTDKLMAVPPPDRVVPKAQRLPREALVAIVNSYFDGITASNDRLVLGEPGCMRLENGLEVTGRPLPPGREDDGYQGKGDCTSGYRGLNIANVAARRYLMVDEEAQVVLASAVFIRTPASPKRRNTFMEVFTIDNGKIHSVHASMLYLDPLLPAPNWAPYEGNFPLSPALVTAQ